MEREVPRPQEELKVNLGIDIDTDAHELGYVRREADQSVVEVVALMERFDAAEVYMTEQRDEKSSELTKAIEQLTQRRSDEWGNDTYYIERAKALKGDCVGYADLKEANDHKISQKNTEITQLRSELEETEAALVQLAENIESTRNERDETFKEGLAAQQALAQFEAKARQSQHQFEESVINGEDEEAARMHYDNYGGFQTQHHGLNNLTSEQRETYRKLKLRKDECLDKHARLEIDHTNFIVEQTNGKNHKEQLLASLSARHEELAILMEGDAELRRQFARISTELKMITEKFNIGFVEQAEPAQEQSPAEQASHTSAEQASGHLGIDIDDTTTSEPVVEEETSEGWLPMGHPNRPDSQPVQAESKPSGKKSRFFSRNR